MRSIHRRLRWSGGIVLLLSVIRRIVDVRLPESSCQLAFVPFLQFLMFRKLRVQHTWGDQNHNEEESWPCSAIQRWSLARDWAAR